MSHSISKGDTFTIAVGDRRCRPLKTAKATVTAVVKAGRGEQITYKANGANDTMPRRRFEALIVS